MAGHIADGARAQHGQAFVRRGPEVALMPGWGTDRKGVAVTAGITDLVIMKTPRSAFADFPRDEFTTLPETRDRLARETGAHGNVELQRERCRVLGSVFRRCDRAARCLRAARQPLGSTNTSTSMAESCRDDRRGQQHFARDAEPPSLPIGGLTRFGMENRNENLRGDRGAVRFDQSHAVALIPMASLLVSSQRVVFPDGVRPRRSDSRRTDRRGHLRHTQHLRHPD